MSHERKNLERPWFSSGISIILGTTTLLNSACFEPNSQKADSPRIPTTEPATPIPIAAFTPTSTPTPEIIPLATRVPMLEGPLREEIKQSVQQSLVRIYFQPRKGLEHLVFEGGTCSGFIIKDSQGKPLIATARHCMPGEVKSVAEGKTYSQIDSDGRSILNFSIADISGKVYPILPYNYYLNNVESSLPDVMLFQVPDPKFNPPALTLDLNPPKKWETYHRINFDLVQNKPKIEEHQLQFFGTMSNTELVFFSAVMPKFSCYPGTSGSPIVDRNGSVVGLSARLGIGRITQKDTQSMGLDRSYIDKDYADCIAVASDKIQGLLRNP